jgi:hypothetical protein
VQTADESAESQRAAVEAVDAAHVQMERPAQEMQQEDSTEILELPSVPGEFYSNIGGEDHLQNGAYQCY